VGTMHSIRQNCRDCGGRTSGPMWRWPHWSWPPAQPAPVRGRSSRCPASIPGRPPDVQQPRSPPAWDAAPGHARRPGRSRCRPARSGRCVRPDCRHGHHSAGPVPAKRYLPVSLTGLSLAHRPSQVKPHKLRQHPKAWPLQAGPGCRLQQPTAFCVFLVTALSAVLTDGIHHAARRYLSLTTARQGRGPAGRRAWPTPTATGLQGCRPLARRPPPGRRRGRPRGRGGR
jgi:hypothetical protein